MKKNLRWILGLLIILIPSISSAEIERRYASMRFVADDVNNITVIQRVEADEFGHPINNIGIVREINDAGEVIRCLAVRWDFGVSAPIFSRMPWGIQVAATGGGSIDKGGPCVENARLEPYNCPFFNLILTSTCSWHCVVQNTTAWCDAAKEVIYEPNQGGNTSVDAGSDCN